ncbi:MAG: 30S ribosome-binding factor RbfA [Bryobacteraceae bacterium]
MDERRTQRVSEALREELAEMIGYELSDPRVAGVDITEVLLSPDLRVAQVRVAVHGGQDARVQALACLEHARHYLRREVSHRLQLYKMPELRFEADADVGGEKHVAQLLKRIRKGRPKDALGTMGSSAVKKSPDDET